MVIENSIGLGFLTGYESKVIIQNVFLDVESRVISAPCQWYGGQVVYMRTRWDLFLIHLTDFLFSLWYR